MYEYTSTLSARNVVFSLREKIQLALFDRAGREVVHQEQR